MNYTLEPFGKDRSRVVNNNFSAGVLRNLLPSQVEIKSMSVTRCPRKICVRRMGAYSITCNYLYNYDPLLGELKSRGCIYCGHEDIGGNVKASVIQPVQKDCPLDRMNCVGCEYLEGVVGLPVDQWSHAFVVCGY